MQQLIEVSHNARSHPVLCKSSIVDYKSNFLLEHLIQRILSHSLLLDSSKYIVSTLPLLQNTTRICVTDVCGAGYLWKR